MTEMRDVPQQGVIETEEVHFNEWGEGTYGEPVLDLHPLGSALSRSSEFVRSKLFLFTVVGAGAGFAVGTYLTGDQFNLADLTARMPPLVAETTLLGGLLGTGIGLLVAKVLGERSKRALIAQHKERLLVKRLAGKSRNLL